MMLQEFCTFCHSEGSRLVGRPKNPIPKGFQPHEILCLVPLRQGFGGTSAQNDGKNTKSAKLLMLEISNQLLGERVTKKFLLVNYR